MFLVVQDEIARLTAKCKKLEEEVSLGGGHVVSEAAELRKELEKERELRILVGTLATLQCARPCFVLKA